MKRRFESGSKKRKAIEQREKQIKSLPKVTSFFAPKLTAATAVVSTAETPGPSQPLRPHDEDDDGQINAAVAAQSVPTDSSGSETEGDDAVAADDKSV